MIISKSCFKTLVLYVQCVMMHAMYLDGKNTENVNMS